MKGSSLVWEYFDKVSTTIATCKLCQLKHKRCGNTTNLKDHLKRKHLVEWSTMKNEDSEMNEDNEIEPSVKKSYEEIFLFYRNFIVLYINLKSTTLVMLMLF